ncbi:MAG: glutamate--cysteine ligase [Pseudomonadota bacterium]
MSDSLEQRISALQNFGSDSCTGMLTGLEREALRVTHDGFLSQAPHPEALGSALTHQYITTDFSEALLEFVTPAYEDPIQTLACLSRTHQFATQRIGDEFLWNASMPCQLGDAASIPLARYGTSNVARMKTVYRRGLSHRYGRPMQAIAGVHFNFSMPDTFWPAFAAATGVDYDERDLQSLRSSAYLGLSRNFRRIGWLVLLLFGASPAMCRTFLDGGNAALADFDDTTLFEPYATSLRMSDLGYSSNAQSRLDISLNTLQAYIDGLTAAIMTPHAPYERIGVEVGGQWRQLNASVLQIENEFYSSIRPKQIARSGERPTLALQRAGVAYVEVRCLDINPYEPVGISSEQMYFMQAMLVACILRPSPPLGADELTEADANYLLMAHSGRAPGLELQRFGRITPMLSWAKDILADVEVAAELLSGSDGPHARSCRVQLAALNGEREVPSAQVLRDMRESGLGYFEFTREQSLAHAEHFAKLSPMDDEQFSRLRREVVESVERQSAIEASAQPAFRDYLAAYYAND